MKLPLPLIAAFTIGLVHSPATAGAQDYAMTTRAPAAAQMEEESVGPYQQFRGEVQLSVAAVLIAPRKRDGFPWDGLGGPAFTSEMNETQQLLPKSSLFGKLLRVLGVQGAAMSLLQEAFPWTITAFAGGLAAPDVQVDLYVDGTLVLRTDKVGNNYVPTWPAATTRPLVLTENSVIVVNAIDVDRPFSADDQIGTCRSPRGIPAVDTYGFPKPHTFRCDGQLWAAAITIAPATSAQPAPEPQPAPSEAAAQPTPQPPAVPLPAERPAEAPARPLLPTRISSIESLREFWRRAGQAAVLDLYGPRLVTFTARATARPGSSAVSINGSPPIVCHLAPGYDVPRVLDSEVVEVAGIISRFDAANWMHMSDCRVGPVAGW